VHKKKDQWKQQEGKSSGFDCKKRDAQIKLSERTEIFLKSNGTWIDVQH
jgi:hypothetical protein